MVAIVGLVIVVVVVVGLLVVVVGLLVVVVGLLDVVVGLVVVVIGLVVVVVGLVVVVVRLVIVVCCHSGFRVRQYLISRTLYRCLSGGPGQGNHIIKVILKVGVRVRYDRFP